MELLELLGKRKESKKVFSDLSASYFVDLLIECAFFVDVIYLDIDKFDVETRHLLNRIAEAGVDISDESFKVTTLIDVVDDVRPVGFPDTTKYNFCLIDRMIALGFDPKTMPKFFFYDELALNFSWGSIIEETTLHSLISRGFPLDPDDFIVIDRNEMNMLAKIAADEGM